MLLGWEEEHSFLFMDVMYRETQSIDSSERCDVLPYFVSIERLGVGPKRVYLTQMV
jgi:hypothetical protein